MSARASVLLVDYGSGNLHSAEKALARASGMAVTVTADPEAVLAAERIVLPGVGAFGHCMALVSEKPGLIEAMSEAVKRGTPFLGVCVGMQLLATRGLEFGVTPGLSWIDGEVAQITPSAAHFKVPHMGWNALTDRADHPLFDGLSPETHMYFTHSFAFSPADLARVIARTDHGGPFTAAVAKDNIAGVQFHPEKSQAAGMALLANFVRWRP